MVSQKDSFKRVWEIVMGNILFVCIGQNTVKTDTIEIIADSLWCQVSVWSPKPRKKRRNGEDSQCNGFWIHHISCAGFKSTLKRQFFGFHNSQLKSSNCVCVSAGESCCPTSNCTFDCPQHLCHRSAWLNPEDATEKKMIPFTLYTCMFSATAGPLHCGPGHTVKGPQMGMNRCHFNYMSSCLSLMESARRRWHFQLTLELCHWGTVTHWHLQI